MSSAFDKLGRILALEEEQGHRDRAVIGGLARFLSFWEKQARQEETTSSKTVDRIMAALAAYESQPTEARVHTVKVCQQLLGQETEGSPCQPAEPQAIDEGPAQNSGTSPIVADAEATTSGGAAPRETEGNLDLPVTKLRGVREANAARLAKLGIRSIRDLLYYVPRRYDDFAQLKTINRLALGDEVTIVGVIQDVSSRRTRRGQALVSAILSDGTGSIEASWFNRRYIERRLRVGSEIVVSGRVDEYLGRLCFSSPEWEPLQRQLLHTARLVPVYPLVKGISGRWLRRLCRTAIDGWASGVEDPLPHSVLDATNLMPLSTALQQVHFPESQAALGQARRRLCFDEFLLLQLGILAQRQQWRSQRGRPLSIPSHEIDEAIARLPFELTGAQRRTLGDILGDLQQPVPMSRLLQGDVGSGKTVIAVLAMLAVAHNGLQAAIMAPTSILAEQHYLTVSRLMAQAGDIRCVLLVGSLSAEEKERAHREISEGHAQVIVGTHALIQEAVDFSRLGLVTVDEQHRFGVAQRAALRDKGRDMVPHLLAMSATPIPRSLALTVYGDLDISILDELPPQRQPIVTAVRDKFSRERIYSFLNGQISQGRQAFIICPLVEESDQIDAKAAVAEHERLQTTVFPQWRLGLLHGRMSGDDKDQVMAAFKAGEYQILVSTAVVEVGIDVPNASVIVVEGAERFGLAQLHQFRGRVGRGEHKSYCILISDDPSEDSQRRLQIMESTGDGFVLAEKDLEMRGPGDFFGVRQHGLPSLRVAELGDTAILELARERAKILFEEDPALAQPNHQLLAASVRRFWTETDLS